MTLNHLPRLMGRTYGSSNKPLAASSLFPSVRAPSRQENRPTMTATLLTWLRNIVAPGLLLCGWVWAAEVSAAPIANAMETARAERVGAMPDDSPSDRMNQLLAARDFNQTEMFVLAASHPGIVEHFVRDDLKLATGYILSLDGAELHRIRNGGTLIRGVRSLSSKEKSAARLLADHFGVDYDKLNGIKVGPQDGRIFVLDLTFQVKKKKSATYQVEMVWPSTPAREEQSRGILTKHFGARPSRTGQGAGSALPLGDASFENQYALADAWRLEQGRVLGAPHPIQEVMLDERIAIDGVRSVRFYATERTRTFQKVVQEVPVQAGLNTRLRVQHKTENIRIEYQQRRSDFKVQLTYLSNGYPMGAPHEAAGRQGSHPWEKLEIQTTVPAGATEARIEIICGLSGTAWFDGIVFEVVEGASTW